MPRELVEIVKTFDSAEAILREENPVTLNSRVIDYGNKIDHASQVVRCTLGLEASEPAI
jgi:hypothetical protein